MTTSRDHGEREWSGEGSDLCQKNFLSTREFRGICSSILPSAFQASVEGGCRNSHPKVGYNNDVGIVSRGMHMCAFGSRIDSDKGKCG